MRPAGSPDFYAKALCAQTDPELFFPEQGQSPKQAKQVCMCCDVRPECAEHAITAPANPRGVWGATTHHERQQIRRLRGITDEHHDWAATYCGTEAGAKRHWRAGEPVCRRCLDAAAATQRARRTA